MSDVSSRGSRLGLHHPLPRARARARPAPEEIPETCEIIRKIKLWIRDTKQSKQQRKQDEQHYTRDKLTASTLSTY